MCVWWESQICWNWSARESHSSKSTVETCSWASEQQSSLFHTLIWWAIEVSYCSSCLHSPCFLSCLCMAIAPLACSCPVWELFILSSFTHQINSKVILNFVLKYILFYLVSSASIWDHLPVPWTISLYFLMICGDKYLSCLSGNVFTFMLETFYLQVFFWAE